MQTAEVDPFGLKSVCWSFDGERLHTSPRADMLAGAKPEIDPQALFNYLFLHVVPSPGTIFKGVQRLPPGHSVSLEGGRPVVRRQWTPRFDELQRPDFDALKDEFRRLLQQAVARQLDGSKPAAFLSGGTDSSTIAGMVGLAAGRPAATYSIGFQAQGYDEMAYARIASRHFGTEHHEYYVTPADLVREMPTVAASYDQPFGNSSAVPAYCCALMARQDGVTKMLAGDGGDELFGGNSRYAKQRVFEWYQLLPAALRRGLLEPALGGDRVRRLPLLRKAASYVEQARAPLPGRMDFYNQLLRLGTGRVLTERFLAAVDAQSLQREQQAAWDAAAPASAVNLHLAFDWRYTLAETDLPKVIGTTRLAGLDVGFPMLDDDLLKFSLRLPSSYKLRGGELRWFFKEALRGFLPDEILRKKKQGFGLPFGVWLVDDAALQAFAADALGTLSDRGVVRADFMQQLLGQQLREHPGYYGEMVWILTMLEHWLRAKASGWRL